MPGRLLAIALVLISSALGQPVISGIVNAARYASAPNDTSGNRIGNNIIAQGSIFAVFGTGMGPATLTFAAGLPLPTSFPDANGTSIAISGAGKTLNASVVYTPAGRLPPISPSPPPPPASTFTPPYISK